MSQRERPVIGFLSDFGLDGAAATCRGVMLGICRDAQIVDICHTVRKYAIRDGAYILRATLPYLPVGVHVAVVDPGVGTERRPIGIRTGRGDILVGPDNGLLPPAAEALGGLAAARALDNRDLWLSIDASSTFHGRDIFAPVAARLAAADATFEDVGPVVDADGLVRLAHGTPRVTPGAIETAVIYVDSFGNARLSGGWREVAAAFREPREGDRFEVTLRERPSVAVTFARSFGHTDPDAALLYVDSLGNLALALNLGDFAARHGIESGVPVRIERA